MSGYVFLGIALLCAALTAGVLYKIPATEGLDFASRKISAARAKKREGQPLTHEEESDLARVVAAAIEGRYPAIAVELFHAAEGRAVQIVSGERFNITSALLSAKVLALQDRLPPGTEEAVLLEDLWSVLVARVANKAHRRAVQS